MGHFRGLSTFVDLRMVCFARWCSESAVESKDFNLSNQMECGSPGSDFGYIEKDLSLARLVSQN